MMDEDIAVSDTIATKMNDLLKQGHTVMLVAYNQSIAGLISVMDVPRKTAVSTLRRLKEIGIKRMIMLTGDHQNVGDTIAKQIGLTEAKGNLLPEDKVDAIKKLLQEDKKIAMVGDGVNDAPAMALSTVSVAMGAAGSDVALETADVALMSDKIEMLPLSQLAYAAENGFLTADTLYFNNLVQTKEELEKGHIEEPMLPCFCPMNLCVSKRSYKLIPLGFNSTTL